MVFGQLVIQAIGIGVMYIRGICIQRIHSVYSENLCSGFGTIIQTIIWLKGKNSIYWQNDNFRLRLGLLEIWLLAFEQLVIQATGFREMYIRGICVQRIHSACSENLRFGFGIIRTIIWLKVKSKLNLLAK